MNLIRKSYHRNLLRNEYDMIIQDCAITTASCSLYAPYLFNMLVSLHRNFPNHPKIYVFDIGMTKWQNKELAKTPWVSVQKVPAFASHWRLCYSWKPFIWNYPSERYRLHLDAGLIVLRSLELWFLAIKKWGYIAFSQGQRLVDITPSSLSRKIGLEIKSVGKEISFAAGIFGFDKLSFAGKAVEESYALTKEGWGLGYSKEELYRAKHPKENIVRDCKIFRHDLTLINLTLRKHCPDKILVRPEKYIPIYKPKKGNKKPFIWSARRNDKRSLYFLWRPLFFISIDYYINRLRFISKGLLGILKRRKIKTFINKYIRKS